MAEHINSEEDWQELLAGYTLGNLSQEERIQLNQYLEEHPESRIELERLQMTLALLPLSLSEGTSPDSLKSRIRTSAAATVEELARADHPASTRGMPRSHLKRRSWSRVVGGIAAVAIATLGFQIYRLQQQLAVAHHQLDQFHQLHAQLRRTTTERNTLQANFVRYRQTVSLLQQPDSRLLNLTGSPAMDQASGSLVIVPSQQVAVLALNNLPIPATNKAYQLWAVVDGYKVDCIKFTPNPDGTILLQMSAAEWVETPMVVITLEPKGETPQPTGATVMSSPQV